MLFRSQATCGCTPKPTPPPAAQATPTPTPPPATPEALTPFTPVIAPPCRRAWAPRLYSPMALNKAWTPPSTLLLLLLPSSSPFCNPPPSPPPPFLLSPASWPLPSLAGPSIASRAAWGRHVLVSPWAAASVSIAIVPSPFLPPAHFGPPQALQLPSMAAVRGVPAFFACIALLSFQSDSHVCARMADNMPASSHHLPPVTGRIAGPFTKNPGLVLGT